jgi:MGT family glycosyltransferase
MGRQPADNILEKLSQTAWQWVYDRIWMRDGAKFLNEARAELGLSALVSPFEQYDRATRVLILGSREFDFPNPLPSNARYVGTPIDDAAVAKDSWAPPWAEDAEAPLVLVSLSTLNQGQGSLLHRILEALEGMPLRAIVTIGPSLDRHQFRPPSNAILATFVPHSAILPHVDAMVTQCGLGSMTKALLCGVPLVCVPVIGEQIDNAVRAEAKGAAVRLKSSASSEEIRSALTRVLADPSYRDAARALAPLMNREPAEDVACDELESLAP